MFRKYRILFVRWYRRRKKRFIYMPIESRRSTIQEKGKVFYVYLFAFLQKMKPKKTNSNFRFLPPPKQKRRFIWL